MTRSLRGRATKRAPHVALACFAAAALISPAAPARSAPAMWTVCDADSTIHLFSTMHFARPDTAWRSPKMAAALMASDKLVLEIVNLDDQAVAAPLIQKHGLDPRHPLTSKLDDEGDALLANAAQASGVQLAQLEPMRPWLGATVLAFAPMQKAGYDPMLAVDLALRAEAKAAGKPITGLETIEQQLKFFADMPADAELDLLEKSLEDFDQAQALFDRMAAAYVAGDEAALDTLLTEQLKANHRAMHKVMLVDCNHDWVRQIEQELVGSGEVFIAVGAAHLVGEEGVPALLKAKGLKVERVTP
jgi:uncharacterized protein YbaP (TraB family)